RAGDRTVVDVAEPARPVAGRQRHRLGRVHRPVVRDPGVGVLAALLDVVGADRPRGADLDHEDDLRRPEDPTLATYPHPGRFGGDERSDPVPGASSGAGCTAPPAPAPGA